MSRCAMVTGGSRGIGAATASALAADGWSVGIVFRRDEESAAGVVEGIRQAGGDALAVQADITQADDIERAFATFEAEFGSVLGLVNNAGARADGLSPQLTDEAWDEVVATNLSAAFRTTRRALRAMLRARFGRIINVASVVGMRASAGQSNYAASKAGLIGFTKTVAAEVARKSITVNAVAPGLIPTDMTAGLGDGLVSMIPARRTGSPEEVAACVSFLASDRASYVTGTTLVVDGGLSA